MAAFEICMLSLCLQIRFFNLPSDAVSSFCFRTDISYFPIYIVWFRAVGFIYKKLQLFVMPQDFPIPKNCA